MGIQRELAGNPSHFVAVHEYDAATDYAAAAAAADDDIAVAMLLLLLLFWF